ncbi:hypothetical protein BS47DRAFT_1368696 [Hydnum rufescens UP504]|uniref:Uncharacterized protein n=1 Tax=Hydnum rufescens UP504 TaxID=1448309 RepID=A0A9P6AFV0_9AGAM|nr:hypothetical protein BS47DRAFT_1368696 [Hydnum rufescens UP504]
MCHMMERLQKYLKMKSDDQGSTSGCAVCGASGSWECGTGSAEGGASRGAKDGVNRGTEGCPSGSASGRADGGASGRADGSASGSVDGTNGIPDGCKGTTVGGGCEKEGFKGTCEATCGTEDRRKGGFCCRNEGSSGVSEYIEGSCGNDGGPRAIDGKTGR